MSRGRADGAGAAYMAGRRKGRPAPGISRYASDSAGRVWVDEDFASVDDVPAAEVTAQLSVGLAGLPHIAAAVRRSWRLWCALALIGLLLGAALYVLHPPAYKASTSLYLSQAASTDATDAILTDVALMQSDKVAEAAMRTVGLPVTPKSVSAFAAAAAPVAVTDEVLQVVVKAPTGQDAVSWAKALATQFLRVRAAELLSGEQSTLAALSEQIANGRLHVGAIGAQINALSAGAPSASRQAELARLRAESAQAKAALSGLEQAVTAYQSTTVVDTQEEIQGSRVLNPAALLPRSRVKEPAPYVGGGLGSGLAVGLGFVIVQALVSVRLRRRDDIAFALGAPVRLSVGRVPASRWQPGARGLGAARSREVQRIVAHLRDAVPGQTAEGWAAGPAALAVVEVDSGPVAALSLVSLAVASARDGPRVMLADLARGAPAARLLGAAKPGVRVVREHGTEMVVAVPDRTGDGLAGPLPDGSPPAGMHPASTELTAASKSADLLLTLVTLDPSHGAEHLPTWAAHAVVVVTAGRSSSTKIHATAEMIRIAGVNLASCVLAGADPADETLGRTSADDTVGDGQSRPAAEVTDLTPDVNGGADRAESGGPRYYVDLLGE
jgi:capsular polysaccharide biosynthesis protein